ncbi:acyl transferase domain-containing protein [Mycolicibacterium conceptionense]|uniref:Acyl transferase domain-containing protein n=1 Tax=Mycolicibacterium conceptionense TaxID=451644 RepID=A0A0U1DE92_9MYCO|nr:acyl transferase domain-containing protein [Mycolicibacterium conceptionense]
MTPIAVIGMGCRLPGQIESPEQFWAALLQGDDLVTEVPAERWDAQEFYDPEPGVPGRSVSKWGAFLHDVAGFDTGFFGISEREATAIDPQHRLLLETAWEAIEHAGIDPASLSGSLTGVFMGLTHGDYQLLAADAHSIEGPYGFTGNNFSLASGRIAYHLGAHGPAYSVDSACSSSLLAVHNACRSLHDGESDVALAGGVCIVLEPRKLASGSAQGMLSPTGHCHAFDVAADGFVAGEAAAVVMLKRLADAERDGDRVLAVIRGTAVNQDGRTVNIATPSRDAQEAVYRAALAAAGGGPGDRRARRGARHGHSGRRPDRVRKPGCRLRDGRAVRVGLVEDQLRSQPIGLGRGRPDEGRAGAAARHRSAQPAFHPPA